VNSYFNIDVEGSLENGDRDHLPW